MTDAADVGAAREYLAGLSDERVVQLWRWLADPEAPPEIDGQMTLDGGGTP